MNGMNNSNYNPANQAVPLAPSNYPQAPTPPTAPRVFTSSPYYSQQQNYMPGQSMPPRSMSTAPTYRHPHVTPLVPIANAPSSSYGSDNGLLMSEESSQQSPCDSPSSPFHSRRNQSHPEGMPQPKGRGARKSTKADDLTKTLSCDGCDAMFARKHDLDRHRRIHTLEAPYMCRGCRRSYRRSDARKRHWDQEPACNVLHVRNSDGGTASSPC